MKKFKSTEEKQDFKQRELEKLLTEKNFFKGALITYSRIHLALPVALFAAMAALLAGFPLLGFPTLIMVCLGMALFIGLSSLKSWSEYRQTPINLRYKTAQYVSKKTIPLLFWGTFIYLTLPFGLWSFLIGLVVMMAGIYYYLAFPIGHFCFRDLPLARHWVTGSCFAGLTLIPLVADKAVPSIFGLAWAAFTFIVFALLNIKSSLLLD